MVKNVQKSKNIYFMKLYVPTPSDFIIFLRQTVKKNCSPASAAQDGDSRNYLK